MHLKLTKHWQDKSCSQTHSYYGNYGCPDAKFNFQYHTDILDMSWISANTDI